MQAADEIICYCLEFSAQVVMRFILTRGVGSRGPGSLVLEEGSGMTPDFFSVAWSGLAAQGGAGRRAASARLDFREGVTLVFIRYFATFFLSLVGRNSCKPWLHRASRGMALALTRTWSSMGSFSAWSDSTATCATIDFFRGMYWRRVGELA
jgi:hypothetical protein